MQESHKIVVKVKYNGINQQLSGMDEHVMVTEWHVKRIVVAIAILIIFILLPFYLFDEYSTPVPDNYLGSEVKPVEKLLKKKQQKIIKPVSKEVEINLDKELSTVSTELPVNITEDIGVEAKLESEILLSPDVVRALLATEVINKEPVGNMVLPLMLNKDIAKRVYYFTEIINMKGQSLYHQWFRDEQLIYKRKIIMLGNRWRASTSKLIPYSKTGMWTVRLVGKQGIILNEIKFEVIN